MKKKSSKSQKAEASEQKQDESPNPFTVRGVAPHEMAGLMNDEQLDQFVTMLMEISDEKRAAAAHKVSLGNSGGGQQTEKEEERTPQERMSGAALAAISLGGIELPPEPTFRRGRELRKPS